MKEVIFLNKELTHKIEFEVSLVNETQLESSYRFNLSLSASEIKDEKVIRRELKIAHIENDGSNKKLSLKQLIIKDSSSHKWIMKLVNTNDESQVVSIGLLSESANKESYFLRTEATQKLESHIATARTPRLYKGIDLEIEKLDQLVVSELLITDKIPESIESGTAHFDNVQRIMRYKDFVITPPQRILPRSEFEFKVKIAPEVHNGVTEDGTYFRVQLTGVGTFTLLDGSMMFREEGSHISEAVHLVFPRNINFSELFTNDFTNRAELVIKGDGVDRLTFRYNSVEQEAKYNASLMFDKIVYQGTRYDVRESDTESDEITKRINAKVAAVTVKFKK